MKLKMKSLKLPFSLILILAIFSCNSAHKETESKSMVEAESVSDSAYSSIKSNATNPSDTTKKLIKEAELKFKVKNVYQASSKIENVAVRYHGLLTYTNLNSQIDKEEVSEISDDSQLVTVFYTVSNEINIKIPTQNLDSALKSISTLIDYLDYRIINVQDAGNDLLRLQFLQERNKDFQNHVNNNKSNSNKDLLASQQSILVNREQSDESKISNLILSEKIRYSSIKLSIYQRQTLKRDVVINIKNLQNYQPSLGRRILSAIKSGYQIFANIIVFFCGMWGVLLIIVIGYILYRVLKKKIHIKSEN